MDLRFVRPHRVLHAEEVGTSLRREQGERKSWRWQLGVTLLVFGALFVVAIVIVVILWYAFPPPID